MREITEESMAGIEVVIADITVLDVDAVVNAANRTLLGGGGVDGAIHRAAGSELLDECMTLGGCPTGEAKITKGYKLTARFVIHTVGPVWHGGSEKEHIFLASCYRKCLELAAKNGCKSIAFPAISCGVYRFPVDQAATIAVREVADFLKKETSVDTVVFACSSDQIKECLEAELQKAV